MGTSTGTKDLFRTVTPSTGPTIFRRGSDQETVDGTLKEVDYLAFVFGRVVEVHLRRLGRSLDTQV